MVQEPRHLSAPEGGDLSAQTVPEADVVEPRNRGGDVLVQLAEDGLACRVQSKGGPRGEDVVAVVAPRRLLWCGVCARKKGGWGRREGLITEGKALLPLVAKVTPRTARRLSKKRERERKSERDTLHTQGEACSNNGRPHIKRKQTGKAGNMGHRVRRPPREAFGITVPPQQSRTVKTQHVTPRSCAQRQQALNSTLHLWPAPTPCHFVTAPKRWG